VEASEGGLGCEEEKVMNREGSEKIRTAINQLMAACGYDKSETATESFARMLTRATQNIDWGIVEESHKDGLAFDVSCLLAESIMDDLEGLRGR
jgi:ABC-type phosphonate transport system ATPase subunit